MGLISLPIMLRYGYSRTIATGTITASGTLAQAIPPSLVLIVLADQLGRSVGDMYSGALIPGLMLVGLYILFIVAVAIFRPAMVPALPPEALLYKEDNGASGHKSLLALVLVCAAVGFGWAQVHNGLMTQWLERAVPSAGDEIVIMSLTLASLTGLALAIINHITKMHLLSRLAEQVTFVLMPPLILIFLVLGTIFLGVATPTEGGAMGALGAIILALGKRRLTMSLTKQALENTAKLASFVLFILIGSTVFSFTFNAADGHIWVEHLFDGIPGGAWGFLVVVNILVFILGCFIDFFEIAFIVIPLLAPVAEKILPGIVPGMTPDQVMIWFGVIIAMNLQTSFLTPPFGFALFYLRSVAAKFDYKDRVTGKMIPSVKTIEIYKGSIAFIILQVIMVAAVIAFPVLVTGGIEKQETLSADQIMQQLDTPSTDEAPAPTAGTEGAAEAGDPAAPAADEKAAAEDDPMKAMLEAAEKDAKK
jgi:TRAP-type mannitol/chloroaromatic compound transport system permease large subunit